MSNADLLKGIVLGAAAAAVAVVAKRGLGDRGAALGHAAVRLGGVLGDKAREVAAEIGEIAEDTLAELENAPPAATGDVDQGQKPAAPEEAPKTGSQ